MRLNISDATEHSRKFRNLPQCVNFEAFDWTIETMTHAAKKATNQYRDDVIFQYKKSKSVPILLPGQNFFTGTKLFHWDKTY